MKNTFPSYQTNKPDTAHTCTAAIKTAAKKHFTTILISLLTVLLLLLNIVHLFAQAPEKKWDMDFGGIDGDFLYSLQQTTDGGFILGGYSESAATGDKTQASRGSADYWIVKTDASGNKQWDARFGGSSVDHLTSVQQTTDGGYILGGNSFSGISGDKSQNNRGQNDYWIVKTDGNGIKQWDARFGGTSYEELNALQQTTDGGYILGGFSMSGANGDKSQPGMGGRDYWIVKVDANGLKQWDAGFGGSQFEVLNTLEQTTDGGYLLGGYSLSGISGSKTQASKGASDFWVVKTNANGVKNWDASFGGNSDDWLTSLQQTTDGGYILGGWSWSTLSGDKSQPTKGDNDYWIVKTDANGVKQWDADYGGNSNDYASTIIQTSDGGYAVAGYSSSAVSGDKTQPSKGGTDYWLVKADAAGTKEWDVQFGGTDFDFLFSMDKTTDGGYVLGGYSTSPAGADKSQPTKGVNNYNDYWVVKTTGSTLACAVPSNLNTLSVTSNEATLDWSDVAGAISYKVRYKASNASTWTTVKVFTSNKTLTGLTPETKYNWEVKTVCQNQPEISSAWSVKKSFTTSALRTTTEMVSMEMKIYPNPVSANITISFYLPEESDVIIDIADLSGRSVNTIADDHFSAGNQEIAFNTSSLSPGVYFVRIKNAGETMVKKLVKN
jgi:hypothetical protein